VHEHLAVSTREQGQSECKGERDQGVGENNRKMTALESEVESEHKCLEKEKKQK
jgi:hypothetical protein